VTLASFSLLLAGHGLFSFFEYIANFTCICGRYWKVERTGRAVGSWNLQGNSEKEGDRNVLNISVMTLAIPLTLEASSA
jgi:hypothetical protein